MAFKLYDNKSSVLKPNTRYVRGGKSEVGEKFIRWWERAPITKGDITDILYTIEVRFAGLPDYISYEYYVRNDLGWVVLQYNDIVDINEELAVGKVIVLPSKERVFYSVLTRQPATLRVTS